MSIGDKETTVLNQLGAHGQGREMATVAPQQWPPVIAQRVVRSGGDSGAPSSSCSTDAQVKSQHVTSKQERFVQKGPTVGPDRHNDSPHSQYQGPLDSFSTLLERLTIARRVANRESVDRSQESIVPRPHRVSQADEPEASPHPAKILISSARKPISYISCGKRFLSEHGEVHLSGLCAAVGPVVTVAEILKSRELAVLTKLHTSLEHTMANESGKSKMDIVLRKAATFDAVIEAEATPGQKAPESST